MGGFIITLPCHTDAGGILLAANAVSPYRLWWTWQLFGVLFATELVNKGQN